MFVNIFHSLVFILHSLENHDTNTYTQAHSHEHILLNYMDSVYHLSLLYISAIHSLVFMYKAVIMQKQAVRRVCFERHEEHDWEEQGKNNRETDARDASLSVVFCDVLC